MAWLFFALYTIFSGLQQGVIVWHLTEYVPPSRKDWIDAAYHTGGILIYLLLIGYALHAEPGHLRTILAAAVLSRALLFDLSLNVARGYVDRREGRPPSPLFQVGTTAATDRLLRRLAPNHPETLRLVLWLATVVAAIALGAFLYLHP